MSDISQKYTINATINKVWSGLTDSTQIETWSGASTNMSPDIGKVWKLWNGDIWGKNIEVEAPKKLVQEWYGGDWPEPSICTFELTEENGTTTVALTHTNVPDDEVESFADGWKNYYMEPLKDLVEKSPY